MLWTYFVAFVSTTTLLVVGCLSFITPLLKCEVGVQVKTGKVGNEAFKVKIAKDQFS